MAVLEINKHPSNRELRQFAGIGWPIFCGLLGAWRVYGSGDWTLAGIIWSLGVLGAVVGWLRPAWVRPVFVGWMYAVFPIGWTVSHLVLAVIYFLILTPIGTRGTLVPARPAGVEVGPETRHLLGST